MKLWLIPILGFALLWSAAALHKERRTIRPTPLALEDVCTPTSARLAFRARDLETGRPIDLDWRLKATIPCIWI